jgi:diaminohydroxyphosphoribosylaminopyrimidine deaminase/5-amino-6-(5-phosphoribosylamino)uracil reductase
VIDEAESWSLLVAAAHTDAARVGPPGRGLARGPAGWAFEAPLTAAAAARAAALLPVLSAGVVAHLAQSLDGRIALPDGRSRWISGEADLDHTHRLRALCDAVLVGAHTVEVDDPQLTVRRCAGPHPLRVVLDPLARLSADRAVFRDDVAPTLRLTTVPCADPRAVVLPATDGLIPPAAVLALLRARGVRRVLIEGGGVTVSGFVAAGCVDRLHLVVAPVLVGAGRPGLSLPAPLADSLAGCPRPATTAHALGPDVLLDCALA